MERVFVEVSRVTPPDINGMDIRGFAARLVPSPERWCKLKMIEERKKRWKKVTSQPAERMECFFTRRSLLATISKKAEQEALGFRSLPEDELVLSVSSERLHTTVSLTKRQFTERGGVRPRTATSAAKPTGVF